MSGRLNQCFLLLDPNQISVLQLSKHFALICLPLSMDRFGTILSCEIIRDWKTGDSLQYAFIEFENRQACENALFKMDGCLVDDRRLDTIGCVSAGYACCDCYIHCGGNSWGT